MVPILLVSMVEPRPLQQHLDVSVLLGLHELCG